jgi:coenzyme PQQ precursor peptide PqqA
MDEIGSGLCGSRMWKSWLAVKCARICKRSHKPLGNRALAIARFSFYNPLDSATPGGIKSSNVRVSKARKYIWGEMNMQWTAPAFEEVCLNCEINSYVSAKL